MKALYEVIVKTLGDQGGISVHTEVLEFNGQNAPSDLKGFKENIVEYESVCGLQIWRSVTEFN